MRKGWGIAACVAALALGACTNATCYDNRSSVPLAAFYGSDGEKVMLDSLEVYAVTPAQADSVIAATPGAMISSAYLPLRPDAETTAWVIAYRYRALDYTQLNDTISMRYTSQPYFASDECGVILQYRITSLDCTSHLIDAVELTDSVISNIDAERIRIYFRTSLTESNP